jgi:ribonuclease HI
LSIILERLEDFDPERSHVLAAGSSYREPIRNLEVYTDGAISSRAIGDEKVTVLGLGAIAVFKAAKAIGVAFTVSKPVSAVEEGVSMTSQVAEIIAVAFALERVTLRMVAKAESDLSALKKIIVLTDSELVVSSVRNHIARWKKNGWMTALEKPVKNKPAWERLIRVQAELKGLGVDLEFKHVPGHVGVIGNEIANTLAIASTKKYLLGLARGLVEETTGVSPVNKRSADVTTAVSGKAEKSADPFRIRKLRKVTEE